MNIMLRANSHRAYQKLGRLTELVPHFLTNNIFNDKSKGYYLVPESLVPQALHIKGITKPRDQNLESYSPCWSGK